MKFIKRIINFVKIFIRKRKNRKLLKKQKSQPMGMNYIDLRRETNPLDVDLLDDNTSQKEKKKVRQYTKILVTALTVMACIWISTSYLLSTIALVMYGNTEPLSSLSEKVCEVIIGVVIAYAFKSYLESYSSARHDLDVMKINQSNEDNIKDEESVG